MRIQQFYYGYFDMTLMKSREKIQKREKERGSKNRWKTEKQGERENDEELVQAEREKAKIEGKRKRKMTKAKIEGKQKR